MPNGHDAPRDRFRRIEELERELGDLRAGMNAPPAAPPPRTAPAPARAGDTTVQPAVQAPPVDFRGRASVPQQQPRRQPVEYDDYPDPAERYPARPHAGYLDQRQPSVPMRERIGRIRDGASLSVLGALFSFVCWGIWAFSSGGTSWASMFAAFVFVLLVAAGVFALCRLLGFFILVRWLNKVRRSARYSHLGAAVFLVTCGVAFLGQTPWVVSLWNWIRSF